LYSTTPKSGVYNEGEREFSTGSLDAILRLIGGEVEFTSEGNTPRSRWVAGGGALGHSC